MPRLPGHRWAVAALVVAGVAVSSSGSALGASEPITTTTSCCAFSKPSFAIDPGTVAIFQNLDPGIAPHDVVANENGTNGRPLFASATIPAGQAPVTGTETLNPGNYRFFCTIHPTQMTGDLVVNGTAPAVGAKVLSRSLDAVVSSGKLKVQLSSASATRGVSLAASLGKAKLGAKGGIDLAAGTRTIAVKLSRAGRTALTDRKSAKVKVAVSVPGGTPVTVKQRLR